LRTIPELIDAVTPLLDQLRIEQVRISQRLYEVARVLADEA